VVEGGNISQLWTGYRYYVGILVPLVTLLIGVIGKKIARGPGWERTDFYLGTELSLAGVSGALVNIFDLLRPEKTVGLLEKKLMGTNMTVVLLGLLLFYIVLSLQQDLGAKSASSSTKQILFLLFFSNFVGIITLVGALMLMEG
jgi:hypothetical protein